MAHPFCCCCFNILNRGRQDYCSFSNIKWNIQIPVLKIPLLGSEARKGPPGSASPATSSQALQTSGLKGLWIIESVRPHHDPQNISRDPTWNLQPARMDQSQRHKAYKRARETGDFARVLPQHGIFCTKGHSSITNPHHPWRKERGKKKPKNQPANS